MSLFLCFSVVKFEELVGVCILVVINGKVENFDYFVIVSYEENGV